MSNSEALLISRKTFTEGTIGDRANSASSYIAEGRRRPKAIFMAPPSTIFPSQRYLLQRARRDELYSVADLLHAPDYGIQQDQYIIRNVAEWFGRISVMPEATTIGRALLPELRPRPYTAPSISPDKEETLIRAVRTALECIGQAGLEREVEIYKNIYGIGSYIPLAGHELLKKHHVSFQEATVVHAQIVRRLQSPEFELQKHILAPAHSIAAKMGIERLAEIPESYLNAEIKLEADEIHAIHYLSPGLINDQKISLVNFLCLTYYEQRSFNRHIFFLYHAYQRVYHRVYQLLHTDPGGL